ncbi:DUF3592 domain-containing protein [Micromonospora chalcea]|uniref:DUF3592 domain-containing protein n=1 Tax=Micromonospora chalcea TaxID=1874 RepID=UPI0004C2CFE3|nr:MULTISPECIES: DUF3592 domain-containing protein [Micromonospora]MCT2277354.1 DUF3592 domain-containing protein [Micromonospora chalcea]
MSRGHRRPFGEWLALLVGVVAATVFLMVAVGKADQDARLLGAETTATGIVLGFEGDPARVAFVTAEGRRVVAEIDVYSGTRVGDEVPVLYHPDDPTWYAMDTRTHHLPFLLPAIALTGAVVMGVMTWRLWRR